MGGHAPPSLTGRGRPASASLGGPPASLADPPASLGDPPASLGDPPASLGDPPASLGGPLHLEAGAGVVLHGLEVRTEDRRLVGYTGWFVPLRVALALRI